MGTDMVGPLLSHGDGDRSGANVSGGCVWVKGCYVVGQVSVVIMAWRMEWSGGVMFRPGDRGR